MESNNPALLDLMARYKSHLREHGLKDELYKWELIERFKGRPDVDAEDLLAEISAVNFGNLLYQMASAVMKHLARERAEQFRACLKALFDESQPLESRIPKYTSDTLLLYRELVPEERYGHHQDERTAGVLLAYHAPEKYPIYKDSFYRKLCKELGIKHKKVGEKYAHYLQLVNQLVENYIRPNEQLQALIQAELPANAYPDPNLLLLTQNMLYVVLDQSEDADLNYWLFQCDLAIYDIQQALVEGSIDQWTVTAHLDSIKPGDKVILWVVGEEAGCYALAEVKSLPGPRKPAADDKYWNSPDPSAITVDIEIIHNFGEDPILWSALTNEPEFVEMARGLRGTNFATTKKIYDAILKLSQPNSLDGRTFWLLAPGRAASAWEEFQRRGIAGIGWSDLGDLARFTDREVLRNEIRAVYQQEGTKKNDTNACWEFAKEMKQGDIVIAKRGTNAYLGWGIVASDYYYDESHPEYPSMRDVDWKKVGVWPEEKIVSKTLTSISKYPEYVQRLIKMLDINFQPDTKKEAMETRIPLNQILYGPPGTGKTYHTINHALKILGLKGKDREEEKRLFEEMVTAGRIAFVTFHQSMSYEDFVEGIKPIEPKGLEVGIGYAVQSGIFKMMCDLASEGESENGFDAAYDQFVNEILEDGFLELKTPKFQKPFRIRINGARSCVAIPTTEKATELAVTKAMIREYVLSGHAIDWKPYTTAIGEYFKTKFPSGFKNKKSAPLPHILIIDEINRGNVSQIFGELITLIEEDKRAGMPEALSVTLPYSKDRFSVPPNLYIIGTMNTADRSVEALDTALRRRFEFVEMAPDPRLVPERLDDFSDVSPQNILHTINLRIEKLLDRDHQIGHAYFMGIQDLEGLKNAFQHKLLPLLQEYFYGDYSKIGLVLGKGFVHKVQSGLKTDEIFAPFESEYRSDLAQREVWHLQDMESMSPEAFLAALDALKPMNFLA